MLSSILLTSYINLVIKPYIWLEPVQIDRYLGLSFYQLLILTGMHCFFSMSSLLYAEADMLRKGNERLLNDFEEGVVILEEGTGNVSFSNRSAKALTDQPMFFDNEVGQSAKTDVE